MAQTVVLKVSMSCEGCAGAVRRVLSKMEGVDDFHIDMKEQKVTVKGSMQPDEVFQKVSKTGKKTSLWEPDQTKDTKVVTEIKEKEEENEATESVAEDKSSVALV